MAKREIRPIRVDGQVAYVPLTKGYTAIIDSADVSLMEGMMWTAIVKRRRDGSILSVYAARYTRAGGRKTIYLHRVLMPQAAQDVDHIDGDGLNNRRTNLRPASREQNAHNARLRPDNTSGAKGVSFYRRKGKWQASIRVSGRSKTLGYFRCPTAAALAYAKASRELHGEFGRVA